MSGGLQIALIGFAIDAVLVVILVIIHKTGWANDSQRVWRKMSRNAHKYPGRGWE